VESEAELDPVALALEVETAWAQVEYERGKVRHERSVAKTWQRVAELNKVKADGYDSVKRIVEWMENNPGVVSYEGIVERIQDAMRTTRRYLRAEEMASAKRVVAVSSAMAWSRAAMEARRRSGEDEST
jgi:hypothetical protein